MLTEESYDSAIRERSLNLRYAQDVIKNTGGYDAIEVHGIKDLGEGIVEVTDEDPDFYSVYVHLKEGGVCAVGDHSRREDALDYAQALSDRYRWPITYS